MFRITRKADYAVFILSFLARRRAEAGSDELVSAQELSSFSSLNKSLVANLLKDLNRAGFLDSVRGARGGYRLAKPPHEITLAAILRTVEGPFTFVECASDRIGESEASSPANGAADDRNQPDPAGGFAADDAPAGDPIGQLSAKAETACCNLSPLCTSQGPLLVLHFRIQQLLEEISLTELSGLDRSRVASVAQELFPARGDELARSHADRSHADRPHTNGHAPVGARLERGSDGADGTDDTPAPETSR